MVQCSKLHIASILHPNYSRLNTTSASAVGLAFGAPKCRSTTSNPSSNAAARTSSAVEFLVVPGYRDRKSGKPPGSACQSCWMSARARSVTVDQASHATTRTSKEALRTMLRIRSRRCMAASCASVRGAGERTNASVDQPRRSYLGSTAVMWTTAPSRNISVR